MPRRPIVLLLAVLAVAAAAVVLIARGGDNRSQSAVADPLGEALSYAPATSQVVAAADVGPDSQQGQRLKQFGSTSTLARFAGEEVRSSLRLLGLDPDEDIPAVVGGPLVIAGPASALQGLRNAIRGLNLDLTSVLRTGAVASITGHDADDVAAVLRRATEDGRLRPLHVGTPPRGVRLFQLPSNAGVLGVRDADLVLGGDAAAVTRAFAVHDRRSGLTRRAFERRLGPLRGPALVRIAFVPQALVGDHAPGVPFTDALRDSALALSLEEPGVRLRVHLATDPARIRADQLPVAPGPAPPSPAPGAAPSSGGIRDLSQTIDVLEQANGRLDLPFLADVQSAVAQFERIKGPLRTFGRIDADAALLDQLTGTTTITREGRGIVLRAELRDGGPLRTALGRIAAIPDFLIGAANITTLDLDRSGDEAFLLKDDGRPILRAAVLGNTLVASTDVAIGLRAVAARRPQRADRPGAVAFHVAASTIHDELVRRLQLPGLARLFLGEIGDLDGSVRSETTGTDLDATLQLRR